MRPGVVFVPFHYYGYWDRDGDSEHDRAANEQATSCACLPAGFEQARELHYAAIRQPLDLSDPH